MAMGDTQGPSVYLTGLNSRSIHTVYAGSFVVYLFNLLADWCHMYYAVKGWTVTFPLKDWCVYLMIGCCSMGSLLNFLLLHLCCENALWHRWTVEPYEGGCRIICQKLCHWITDFDCFRISFLIMVFEDAPMTVINFWIISACSISNPEKSAWPFYLSCATTTISLAWRAVMVFLAYRSIYFISVPKSPSHNFHSNSDGSSSASTMDDFKNVIGIGHTGNRLKQYDECWPVRTSVYIAYHKEKNSNIYTPVPQTPDHVIGYCCRAVCCCFLCQLLYAASFLVGCAPCCYHYVCRKNAAQHRHKFAKNCTKWCTAIFNVSVLCFSIVLLISCLVLNMLWLSSVHLLGNDRSVPEINRLCVSVDTQAETIQLGLMPANHVTVQSVDNSSSPPSVECKLLFEDGEWGFWWQRRKSNSWIHVVHNDAENGALTGVRLAVWTYATIATNANDQDVTKISYDVAYRDQTGCYHSTDNTGKWKVSKNILPLPWPYWFGCECKFKLHVEKHLICNVTL